MLMTNTKLTQTSMEGLGKDSVVLCKNDRVLDRPCIPWARWYSQDPDGEAPKQWVGLGREFDGWTTQQLWDRFPVDDGYEWWLVWR